MTDETKPTPQQPEAGSLLDVIWRTGADMARVTLALKGQSNVQQSAYPSVPDMQAARTALIKNGSTVPANLDQVLGPRS